MATTADDSRFGQGYGHDGAAAIKIHPFFRVIDWHALAQGKVCNFVILRVGVSVNSLAFRCRHL